MDERLCARPSQAISQTFQRMPRTHTCPTKRRSIHSALIISSSSSSLRFGTKHFQHFPSNDFVRHLSSHWMLFNKRTTHSGYKSRCCSISILFIIIIIVVAVLFMSRNLQTHSGYVHACMLNHIKLAIPLVLPFYPLLLSVSQQPYQSNKRIHFDCYPVTRLNSIEFYFLQSHDC